MVLLLIVKLVVVFFEVCQKVAIVADTTPTKTKIGFGVQDGRVRSRAIDCRLIMRRSSSTHCGSRETWHEHFFQTDISICGKVGVTDMHLPASSTLLAIFRTVMGAPSTDMGVFASRD